MRNNLKGEYSLSSQDVPQRLIINYVLDLPFGHGKKWMSDATGIKDKVIAGWGIDGVTTLQRGFPLKINRFRRESSFRFGVGHWNDEAQRGVRMRQDRSPYHYRMV